MEIKETLAEYGLTEETYEAMLKDISDKTNKQSDMDWAEISEKYNLGWNGDSVRKGASIPLVGGTFVAEYLKEKFPNENKFESDNYLAELENAKKEIRKERMKLQTLNIERNRFDRAEAKQELYYEYVGSVVEALPVPEFEPLLSYEGNKKEYWLGITDLHYGAAFNSENNEYSPEIAQRRFEFLAAYIVNFVQGHNVDTLNIASCGDSIQGILRVNDLKLNESSIVKATVEVSRLIANFLNYISKHVNVNYYHVGSANHTQLRLLGTKANELASEDLEYVIGNYISDLTINNERVNVVLSEEGKGYIVADILGETAVIMHGHQIKDTSTAIEKLSKLLNKDITYLIFGHQHGGKEFIANEGICCDSEVIILPSFVGSDPFSDSILRGSKAAAKILGFEEYYGHTETYKIQLN